MSVTTALGTCWHSVKVFRHRPQLSNRKHFVFLTGKVEGSGEVLELFTTPLSFLLWHIPQKDKRRKPDPEACGNRCHSAEVMDFSGRSQALVPILWQIPPPSQIPVLWDRRRSRSSSGADREEAGCPYKDEMQSTIILPRNAMQPLNLQDSQALPVSSPSLIQAGSV